MSSVPTQLSTTIRCGLTTRLTAFEAARLRAISCEVPAGQDSLSCEIVAGHDGNHVAFATADHAEQWWWLCWERATRVVRQIELCDARCMDDPYQDDCLLPAGHPGSHSFYLRDG